MASALRATGIPGPDIEPCGFDVVLMDGFLTEETVEQVRKVLEDEQYRRLITDHNYGVGRKFFSYRRVQDELLAVLAKPALCPITDHVT